MCMMRGRPWFEARDDEGAALRSALDPDEAALVSVRAEVTLLAGAERSSRREAAAMAMIAETGAMIHEQKALVERLQDVQVLATRADPSGANVELGTSGSGASMTLRITTCVPSTPTSAMELVDGFRAAAAAGPSAPAPPPTAPPRRVTHTMTVLFHPGFTAIKVGQNHPKALGSQVRKPPAHEATPKG
jgi:hypothetical protein